jgi:hypothetical protein
MPAATVVSKIEREGVASKEENTQMQNVKSRGEKNIVKQQRLHALCASQDNS